MLKPGSSKLKESEAELLQEIREFELQEDKTLHNMEETMRMMTSSQTPQPPRSSIVENLGGQPPQKQTRLTTIQSGIYIFFLF